MDSHKFLISEMNFIDKVLGEWYTHKKKEQKKLLELIDSYDDNKDGVMQFSEFEELLKYLEPKITKKEIQKLFNEALSM